MSRKILFIDTSGTDGKIVFTESEGGASGALHVEYSGPVAAKEYVEKKRDEGEPVEDVIEKLLIDMPQELPVQEVKRVE